MACASINDQIFSSISGGFCIRDGRRLLDGTGELKPQPVCLKKALRKEVGQINVTVRESHVTIFTHLVGDCWDMEFVN